MSRIESTYKARDVEETIDIYFYRPLGYVVANACRAIRITPNAVTIASIIIGVVVGRLLSYRDLMLNAWGIVLWIISDTLDSADGQLARMINSKSKLGRILDGFGSNIIFLSIYLHLLARITDTYEIWWLWLFPLVLAGGISHSIQSALADYYRNAYLKFVIDARKSELESAEEIRAEYQAVSFFENPVRKILLRVYLNYTVEQEMFSKNFQALRKRIDTTFGYDIPRWFSDEYRRVNKPLMKYYAILTTNTRMIVMFVCVMFDLVPLYFIIEIIGINGVMILVTTHQEKLSKRLLAQIDERKT